MRLARLGVAVIAALCAAAPATGQTCGLTKVATYDMESTDSGHVVIKMKIGDEERLMAVDTGAWFSHLTEETVDALKLPHQTSDQFISYDAYGRHSNEVATAPSLDIGPLKVRSVDFIIAPRGANFGKDVSGLLGGNVLKHFDLDFDFANRKFSLFDQDHCPGQVVYWTASGFSKIPFEFNGSQITLPVTLDGHQMEAMLDTGAFASTISTPMANQIFDLTQSSADVDRTSHTDKDGTTWTDYTHVFNALRFGGMTIPSVTLHLVEDKMGKAVQQERASNNHELPLHLPQVLIGIEELRHLHLYISYKEKLLYVTVADAH